MPTIMTIARRLVIAIACLHAAGTLADCVDTVGLSPAERDFHVRANAALKSFLRPAPAGENIRVADTLTDPQGIQACKGDKKPGDFTVRVQRKYIWPDPKKHSADTAITLELAINMQSFGNSLGNYSGSYGSPSPGRSAGLQVHNVEWRLSDSGLGVQAQRDSLRASLVAVLERDRLQGLVGRPLPSVAESEAMARKAPPTQLVTPPSPAAAPAVATSAGNPTPTAPAAAPQPASPSGTAPSAPAPADTTVKDAADAVQKLRGLFGR